MFGFVLLFFLECSLVEAKYILLCRVDVSQVVGNQLKRVQRKTMELILVGFLRVLSLAQVRSGEG